MDSGYATKWDEVVFRGEVAAHESVAFWLKDQRLVAGLNRNAWDAREPIPELIRSRALDPCEFVRPAVPLSELAEAEHASEGTEALSTWASERVRYDHAGCWCVD
jgi:hypothetical protein